MVDTQLKLLFDRLSTRKLLFSFIFGILFIGFLLTFLLGGQPNHFTEDVIVTDPDFHWGFTSPGIQWCTLTADPSNSVPLDVDLAFTHSDVGFDVQFQLAPGETRRKNLILHANLRSPSYAIYRIWLSFDFPSSQAFTPQQVTITVTVLTATLPSYLTNWSNTSTWVAPLSLVLSVFLSLPISVLAFFWRKSIVKTVFWGSTCFLWAILLGYQFYTIRAYSLYTLSLLPLVMSLGLSGLILLFVSLIKGIKAKDLNSYRQLA